MPSASVQGLFEAAEKRISCYTLTNKSTISDDRIKEIVSFAVKHGPSPFNVQSARAVILLKQDHEKLWDIADAMLKRSMPEQAYQKLAPRVAGFKGGYGSVLWFEDQEALDGLKAKNPAIQHVTTEWSDHSSGFQQILGKVAALTSVGYDLLIIFHDTVWTALELEGLGCNLQHYNFSPDFTKEVLETWDLPKMWLLKAQLVFGTPQDGLKRRHERTYLPLEDRVKFIGS
jgi:uncharacterized protein